MIVVWNTTATSGDVVWSMAYTSVGGDSAESLDPSSDQGTGTVTDTASGTALQRQECSISFVFSDLAAGDECLFNFYRDGASVSDTLAASSYVYSLLFEYANA
jgi:hypothetical protein